ncbi:MAG TPA: DNA-binding protein [Clostridia bacterium]|jgi:predicted DNA-binding protein YlxM (UPF0122 family)|nr:DNA-binding protein [Clostridia bacterium]
MDDLTFRALAFDFYGSLLTNKQREIYDLYHQQDLSLGEIAVLKGVTREAVYDLLKRAEGALQTYENKLKLVKKYLWSREIIGELKKEFKGENRKHILLLLQKLEDSW